MENSTETTAESPPRTGRARGTLRRVYDALRTDESKAHVTMIAFTFVAIGAVLSLPFGVMLFLWDFQVGVGGAAIVSYLGVQTLFASGILAAGFGLYVGARSSDHVTALSASGVGSYLGYVGIVLTMVVAIRLVGSDVVVSSLGFEIEGFLAELLVAGLGIGIVGAGAGSLGYSSGASRPEPRDARRDERPDAGDVLGRLPGTITDPETKRPVLTAVYAIGLVGLGYGVLTILLNFAAGAIVGPLLAYVASHAIVFSAPLFAAYLGGRAGASYSLDRALAVGVLGGGGGFVAMILVMILGGAYGPGADVATLASAGAGFVDGEYADAMVEMLEVSVSMSPQGYELSRILVIGTLASAIAGGVAAALTNGIRRVIT